MGDIITHSRQGTNMANIHYTPRYAKGVFVSHRLNLIVFWLNVNVIFEASFTI